MKKLISVIFVAITIFSLVACGNNGKDTNSQTLKVAISPDYAPMVFVDSSKSGNDAFVGFDISLAHFIADELGMELEIMPMNWEACQVSVEAGTVDMSISGFIWTESFEQKYNLSDYYYVVGNEERQIIITTKDKESTFNCAEDFSKKVVAVQASTLTTFYCYNQLPADCEIVEVNDLSTAISQLINGDFDALATTKGESDFIINSNSNNIVESGFEFDIFEEDVSGVILLQKGADILTEKVNNILAKARDSGYYYNWCDEAISFAESERAVEISYDNEGNIVSSNNCYYDEDEAYVDTSKASGILANLGLTEEEFKNSCQKLFSRSTQIGTPNGNELYYSDLVKYPNNYIDDFFVIDNLYDSYDFHCTYKGFSDDGYPYYEDDERYDYSSVIYDFRDDIYSPNIVTGDDFMPYVIFKGLRTINGEEWLVFYMITMDIK